MLVLSPQDQQYVQSFIDNNYDLSTVDSTKISPIAFRTLGDLLVSSDCTAQQQRCYIELGRENFLTVVRVVIRCFTLLDEEYRFQLIVESFGKDFMGTCSSLSNFNLSKERLLEAALRYPRQAARRIQYFQVTSNKTRKMLDQFFTEHAPLEYYENRRNGFSADLFQVSRAAILVDPIQFCILVKEHSFTDSQAYELFLTALSINRECLQYYQHFIRSVSDGDRVAVSVLRRYLREKHPLVTKLELVKSDEARQELVYIIVKYIEPFELEDIVSPLDIITLLLRKKGHNLSVIKRFRHCATFVQQLIITASFAIDIGCPELLLDVIERSKRSTIEGSRKLMLCTTFFKFSGETVWKGNYVSLEQNFNSLVLKEFSVDKADDLFNFFLQFRVPMAPMIYYTSILQIKDEDVRKSALVDFLIFLDEAVKGTLETSRMKSLEGVVESKILTSWSAGTIEEYDGFTLEDTGSPFEILLMGTEIKSCQCISYSGTNLGILGKLLNGYNRIIILKQKGRQVKRAVFRLMMQKGGLVLFLEQFYSAPGAPNDKVLLDFAHRRANALGLPLIRSATLSNPLSTLPGRSHFEHSDASDGLIHSSEFTIPCNT